MSVTPAAGQAGTATVTLTVTDPYGRTAADTFVVTANAWMNTPAGFRMVNGQPVDVDPIAAMMNPAAFSEVLHMLVAAYLTAGFAVAAVHAFMPCTA